MQAIAALREKFGGSSLFGNEKDDSFKSSIGQIYQTFGGNDLYPSVEEKAAMLLYLVTKNHSFSDGNKRIAATLFLWFLNNNGILYRHVLFCFGNDFTGQFVEEYACMDQTRQVQGSCAAVDGYLDGCYCVCRYEIGVKKETDSHPFSG